MDIQVEKLRIVHYPDPVLRQKAQQVETVTDEIRAVAQRMLQLMHDAPGVGLAAPQVGLSIRLFVANDDPEQSPDADRVFINPTFSDASAEIEPYQEGCLSLPEIRAEVRRPRQITIHATGLDGQPFSMTSDQLAARIWQHEADHLDGVLILDRMSPIDRMANKRAIKALENA